MAKEISKKSTVKSIICLLAGLIFMLPVFLIVMNAFKPNKEILTSFLSLPKSLYLDNFKQAMDSMNFSTAFRNTLFVTAFTVLIACIISFTSAYGISHLDGKLGDGLYLLFVLGHIIPFHAVMIAISILAKNLNLTNTHLGLIIFNSGFFTSFGVMTYVGFLKSVPRELEEAAAIDGASPFRTMTQIILPLVKSSTVTLVILYFLWTWNDLLLPTIIISDESLRTITVNLYMFKTTTNAQWNLLIAGLTVSMIPIIVIYIAGQKYITSGLTAGAVK
ncbi:carbohydrate ABC transporter permease [Blautia liquoris]|uniref:Carbohydrate ABC transporter permease n=1 Tax=Blautia liquoris TaxID=2779518 RepID=A0A7M2REP3_9FIRM|nr:carbohydrate ABC transporter permease [Blautia liquoris]QOV18796.1 carbohydrate ABC transporter permease [Blautia liquoris]